MFNGELKIIEGLSIRNPIDEGLYDVYFAHLLEPEELNDDEAGIPDRSVWFVLIPAEDETEVVIDGVPGM